MENIEILLELAQSKIEEILVDRGFEELEFINKDKDGEKDFIFNYNTTEIEFGNNYKVSTHLNIENYQNDMDFSKIEIYGYVTYSGGPIFEEDGNIIKEDYLMIITMMEKEKIFNSLKDTIVIEKTNRKNRI